MKVMAWGTLDGQMTSAPIGYLPDEIANECAGAELDVWPKAALLPGDGFPHLSIELALLERSAAYLKRMAKDPCTLSPHNELHHPAAHVLPNID